MNSSSLFSPWLKRLKCLTMLKLLFPFWGGHTCIFILFLCYLCSFLPHLIFDWPLHAFSFGGFFLHIYGLSVHSFLVLRSVIYIFFIFFLFNFIFRHKWSVLQLSSLFASAAGFLSSSSWDSSELVFTGLNISIVIRYGPDAHPGAGPVFVILCSKLMIVLSPSNVSLAHVHATLSIIHHLMHHFILISQIGGIFFTGIKLHTHWVSSSGQRTSWGTRKFNGVEKTCFNYLQRKSKDCTSVYYGSWCFVQQL